MQLLPIGITIDPKCVSGLCIKSGGAVRIDQGVDRIRPPLQMVGERVLQSCAFRIRCGIKNHHPTDLPDEVIVIEAERQRWLSTESIDGVVGGARWDGFWREGIEQKTAWLANAGDVR